MLKKALLFAFTVIVFSSCNIDTNSEVAEEIEVFNNISNQLNDAKNIDSIKVYLHQYDKLRKTELLDYLIHNVLAQDLYLNENIDTVFNTKLLEIISSNNTPVIKKHSQAIVFYSEALNSQKHSGIIEQNKEKVNFNRNIIKQTNSKILFSEESLSERYRIMLFNLNQCSENEYILDEVIKNSNSVLSNINNEELSERDLKEKRGLYRYFTAHCYYLKGRLALDKNDENKAEMYFEKANFFSPDRIDREVQSYFYEVHFLNGLEDYSSCYADVLLLQNDTLKTIEILSKKAADDFSKVVELKSLYEKNNQTISFNKYWANKLMDLLPVAPEFKLRSIDGEFVELNSFKGKWILLDFWGTWCSPCKEELPKVQNISTKIFNEFSKSAVVYTIACRDEVATVKKFMKEKKYKFNVLMSDENVEKDYKITGYPTKILITPTGHYFILYFNSNWEEVVEAYVFNDSLYKL